MCLLWQSRRHEQDRRHNISILSIDPSDHLNITTMSTTLTSTQMMPILAKKAMWNTWVLMSNTMNAIATPKHELWADNCIYMFWLLMKTNISSKSVMITLPEDTEGRSLEILLLLQYAVGSFCDNSKKNRKIDTWT